MKHDTALAVSIASSLPFVIVVGVSTSARAPEPDFVDSLARLYLRALPRKEALRIYRGYFVQALAARSGLRGDALKTRAKKLCPRVRAPAGRKDLSRRRLREELAAINDAFRRVEHGDIG